MDVALTEGKQRTSNDQKSDRWNDTSAEYKAAMDHNAQIHDPNSQVHQAMLDNRSGQIAANKAKGRK